MKRTNILSIFILTIVFCAKAQATAPTDTLKIKTSARCEDCKERIENKLKFSKGIKWAKVDLNTKIVTVVYSPEKTNANIIKESITKVGYDADEKTSDAKAYKRLPKCCKKSDFEHKD
jgi:periplasmic mercuric ion binding protein